MNWYFYEQGVLTLNLHVQPKASKDEWAGLHGDRLKLRIKAPPIDGRANQHLLKFIAGEFGVSKSACTLISGESGREKRVAIDSPRKLPDLPEPLRFDISLS
ncbi:MULTISPECIES: DUF167 family protein [unclassified Methylobacter]|jgi:uncharacterized protein (TIGR00251 family)|uniref:DUF167 family protein n=1 Tax=unclassified Methylobacter TaxID=2635283 RepID=UPI0018946CBB|nr:DUF167 family protein [Methylobacter sp. BlB1]MBF6648358.1 YggU family protein [Methylobacter sp. BlB1]